MSWCGTFGQETRKAQEQIYLVDALGHDTRMLYYKRGNAIVEILSYPAIIGVAISRYFAAARFSFFATFGVSRRPR